MKFIILLLFIFQLAHQIVSTSVQAVSGLSAVVVQSQGGGGDHNDDHGTCTDITVSTIAATEIYCRYSY